MPHKTTVKLEVSIDKGPIAKPVPQEIAADSYMPVSKEIKPDKAWHSVRIDGGESKHLQLMLVHSDRYRDQTCPGSGPALFFKFLGRNGDGGLQPPDKVQNAYPMHGPLFFSCFTLSMLPQTIDGMAFRNLTLEPVHIEILLAKGDCEEPDHVDISGAGTGGKQQSQAS